MKTKSPASSALPSLSAGLGTRVAIILLDRLQTLQALFHHPM